MNKKIAVIGIVLLIAVSFAFVRHKNAWNAPVGEQQNPCASAPAEYKAKCAQANAWFDRKLVEWKPAEYRPMKFNGHLLFESEEMIDVTGENAGAKSIDAKFLEMLSELNTDTISLFIYPDMFKKYETRYGELINGIRASNKQLYVSYMVGGGYNFTKFSSFKEYKDTELNFTKMFAEKYHPDYYVVVDEITTMERRTGLKVSDDEWKALVIETVNLVKNISPETKTVATGHSQELGFLKSLAGIKNLDMVGLNIWGIDQIDETTQIGKEIKNTVNYAEKNGKGVVFEQTWSLLLDAPEAKKLSTQDFMKPLDAKYVRAISYYANRNNVSIYGPFYTGKFVSYSFDPAEFEPAFNKGARTPVFYAYKDTISEFKQ